jgi:hypothetical protein
MLFFCFLIGNLILWWGAATASATAAILAATLNFSATACHVAGRGHSAIMHYWQQRFPKFSISDKFQFVLYTD